MMLNIKDLAEHVNNLFNVDNPELVEVPNLTRQDAHKLDENLTNDFPKRYETKLFIEVSNKDKYTLSIRKK